MPDITINTMILAIQAVAAQVKDLRTTVASDDAQPEEMQQLEEWLEAAEDLEQAYDTAAKTVLNLPPYNELVGE
jgi:thiamine kinase-like enzyme